MFHCLLCICLAEIFAFFFFFLFLLQLCLFLLVSAEYSRKLMTKNVFISKFIDNFSLKRNIHMRPLSTDQESFVKKKKKYTYWSQYLPHSTSFISKGKKQLPIPGLPVCLLMKIFFLECIIWVINQYNMSFHLSI